MTNSPAGWYTQADGRQRYWDGATWTEHFAPGGDQQNSVAAASFAAATPSAARPWFKKKRFVIPAGLAALAIMGSALSDSEPDKPLPLAASTSESSKTSAPSTSASAVAAAATPAPTPSAAPAAPAPKPKPKVVSVEGDGIYDVGSEMKPGLYRSEGAGYSERLKNASGDFDAILANGNAVGVEYVQVKKSDGYFSTQGMDDWVLVDLKAKGPQATKFDGDGTYRVGIDIKPGTYKSSGDGYWERLKSASGDFSGILANGNASGNAIVQIKKTDKFFSTQGMGTWVRVK